MKKNLRNNNFSLITGGTSGIGASFAFKLSELGYNLIIVGSNKSKLIRITNKIKNKFNNKVLAIQCDLSKENSYKKIISAIKSKKLKIKFFIQSAGMGYPGWVMVATHTGRLAQPAARGSSPKMGLMPGIGR